LETDCFVPVNTLQLKHMAISISADVRVQMGYEAWLSKLEAALITLWPHFLEIASEEGVFEILGIDYARHDGYLELTWVGNDTIHQLNRDYRQKDSATDVLSFTLLADTDNVNMWLSLPQFQLGSIFISLDWALEHYAEAQMIDAVVPEAAHFEKPLPALEGALWRYLMERVLHGFLHLHGQHHDTMPEFERVVRIQNRILDNALSLPITVMDN
jgi:probable rRNA maturation factor